MFFFEGHFAPQHHPVGTLPSMTFIFIFSSLLFLPLNLAEKARCLPRFTE
jgi:hypothetical protein